MSKHIEQDGSPDSVVDRAIDRAVRRMLDVDPLPGFRGRVMSRLDSPAPRGALFPRLTLAAAALATVALAVFLLRPEPAPVSQPAGGTSATAPAVAVATPAQEPSRPASVEAQAKVATADRPAVTDTPIRMPRISNVFGTRSARVAAAAADVDDVVFPALPGAEVRADAIPGTPRPIDIPSIAIAPLQIDQVRVEPMPIRR